jgi:hypothetical protein
MRIGLIIADFEMSFTTSFQHTARVKYGVDFNSSNAYALGLILHVQNLLNQILEKYREVFHVLPPNMKIYTITQKLKESEAPSAKELAKEVLTEVLNPEKPAKTTKAERKKADAEALSAKRALAIIRKNSAKGK